MKSKVNRWTGALLLGVGVLTASEAVSAATYGVTDLGELTNLPSRTDSRPNAIGSNAHVAGVNLVNGAYRALLYGGVWTNLGTLGGGESYAEGVNDSDQVAGHSTRLDGSTRAFLWKPGGTTGVPGNPQMEDLGTLGGLNSEAYDINNSMQITGYAQTSNRDHAFRYANGMMTDIGRLISGLPNSFGYSINEAGHVAGTAYSSNYATSHAFYFDGNTAVDMGTLGGSDSSALSINNSDHIAGYLTTASGVDHAFRYVGGVMTDIGTLGGDYSYAISINNSNTIVGGSYVDANNSVYHAFLYLTNSMVDLNGQLDASGAGWTLVEARAINDSGQIVGVGRSAGADHAFLLTPKVPGLAPTITGLTPKGPNLLLSFTTIQAIHYTVESRASLASGGWTDAIAGIAGTGGIVTVTNSGVAALPPRFYRIRTAGP